MLRRNMNPKRCCTDLFHAQFSPRLFSRMYIPHKTGRLVSSSHCSRQFFIQCHGSGNLSIQPPDLHPGVAGTSAQTGRLTYLSHRIPCCTSTVQSATQAVMLCLIADTAVPYIVIDDTACSIMPPAHLVSNKKLAFGAQFVIHH